MTTEIKMTAYRFGELKEQSKTHAIQLMSKALASKIYGKTDSAWANEFQIYLAKALSGYFMVDGDIFPDEVIQLWTKLNDNGTSPPPGPTNR